ncbi:MAG: DUF3780 domain-containing protein [Victivallales bacterium]|nr:DUF3780 domain-containing protein [Victivallales bacterium]
MKPEKLTYGFGVDPLETRNHFFVVIPPKGLNLPVSIFERFNWTDEAAIPEDENLELRPAVAYSIEDQIFANGQRISRKDVLRLEISRHKCRLIYKDLASELNARLKERKLASGKFVIGGTPVEKMFGKEMMVLLWGIEDCDPSNIPTAIRNWRGLMPEERWWLYTMTNASTGKIKDKRGWRTALRYALCENPVQENRQLSFDDLFEDDKEQI